MNFSATRPIVIAGLGARRPDDADAIRAFCARHGVPALVTYKAKGVVADDDPWFAGVFTNAVLERPVVDRADLIIALGLDPVELLPRAWPWRAPVVYVGPWAVDMTQVPFTHRWVTDVAPALGQLDACVERSAWTTDEVAEHRRQQRVATDIPGSGDGLTAQRVVAAVATAFAASARVTVDAGAHMLAATLQWPTRAPGDLLISNGLSTMGFALPAAIGAAQLDRGRPVVALTGDGGLLMCAGELLTVARERLRVVVIVFNDASLSLIEIKQMARRLPAAGVAIGHVDWAAIARGMGVTAFSASTDGELAAALRDAALVDGPVLIDVQVDRSNYGATLRAVRG